MLWSGHHYSVGLGVGLWYLTSSREGKWVDVSNLMWCGWSNLQIRNWLLKAIKCFSKWYFKPIKSNGNMIYFHNVILSFSSISCLNFANSVEKIIYDTHLPSGGRGLAAPPDNGWKKVLFEKLWEPAPDGVELRSLADAVHVINRGPHGRDQLSRGL